MSVCVCVRATTHSTLKLRMFWGSGSVMGRVRERSWVKSYDCENKCLCYTVMTLTLCTNASSAPLSGVTKNEHACGRRSRMTEKPVLMTQRQAFFCTIQ